MPAKKAIKASKVASKIDHKKQVASKSLVKSVPKLTPKSAVKPSKVTASKVNTKVNTSSPKNIKSSPKDVKSSLTPLKGSKASKSKDFKYVKVGQKTSQALKSKDIKASSSAKDVKATSALKAQKSKPEKPIKADVLVKDTKAATPTPVIDSKAPLKKTQSKQQIIKVITKGGAAVDSFVANSTNYRVHSQNSKIYSATLNQSNLDANNNKFYIIQVLVHQTSGQIFVWNRWGRVGVPGANALKGPFDKNKALSDFNNKYQQKAVKGDYREIQIKYDNDEDQNKHQPTNKKGPKKEVQSKMDESLQRLMGLIFDVNLMNNTMKEIGYDAKRMPLGKLGDSTIKQAYTILNNLTQAIKNNRRTQFNALSSQFFTLIPHDFGFQKMSNFVLDNEQKVKEKLKMLETISDMKITTKLLQQKANDQDSIHDQNYKKLGCTIKPVTTSSNDYKLLTEYFDNTKSSFSKVKVGDIYEVVRPTEQSNYNTKIGNNMLLWHGSRLSNFVGILSQGLRIAPPEAPVSGYLFGKGIYLADMAQKSIHYCRSHGSDTALILLIEGAIGDPNILLQSSHQAKQLMEKNKKNSTKCHGSKAPPSSSYANLKGSIVPKGKPQPTGSGSYMGHNEFIVYNMNQARIKYILRMDMKGS